MNIRIQEIMWNSEFLLQTLCFLFNINSMVFCVCLQILPQLDVCLTHFCAKIYVVMQMLAQGNTGAMPGRSVWCLPYPSLGGQLFVAH